MRNAEFRMWEAAADRLSIPADWLSATDMAGLSNRWGIPVLRFPAADWGAPDGGEYSYVDWHPPGAPDSKYWP